MSQSTSVFDTISEQGMMYQEIADSLASCRQKEIQELAESKLFDAEIKKLISHQSDVLDFERMINSEALRYHRTSVSAKEACVRLRKEVALTLDAFRRAKQEFKQENGDES